MSKDIYKEESKQDMYWQDVENKTLDPKVLKNEFAEDEFDSFSIKKNRRSFLKIMGYSVSALPLTGCIKIPVRKAIPYLKKNDTVIPGVANWYASTFGGYPVLVKTREGRPIKIEGNAKSMVTMGGANAQMQASVLSLYDSYRFTGPMIDGSSIEWSDFDAKLKEALVNNSKPSYIVMSPNHSPSEQKVIKTFAKKTGAKVVVYDSVANNALLDATESVFGKRIMPQLDLEAADVIVSFGADFLGTYGNELSQTKGYVARRKPKHSRGMNRHYQVESLMSMTGANADIRYTRSVADQRKMIIDIYNFLSGKTVTDSVTASIAKDLKSAGSRALLVSNDTDKNVQILVAKINSMLGAYGKTIFAYDSSFKMNSNNNEFDKLVKNMESSKVGAVFFLGVNPAYDYRLNKAFTSALSKVDVRVSFAMAKDETAALCNYIAPTNHTYESWSDSQVSHDEFSFTQPVIQPLFGTRMAMETLMAHAGIKGNFHDFVKSNWKSNFFNTSGAAGDNKWNNALHEGVVTLDGYSKMLSGSFGSVEGIITSISKTTYPNMSVELYQKSAMTNGHMANNPWLHEMPDPVTKATWDNYIMVSPKYAKSNGLKSGDVCVLKSSTHSVKLPVIVQPGTDTATFGVAVGYGRRVAGKVAKNLGANAFGFSNHESVTLAKTGEFNGLAQTQTHHSMEGRDIIRETTFAEYVKDNKAGNHKKARLVNIYPEHKKDGHQWAMAIDLASCTGCSSCIISCNAENNVPVVGRQEVKNRREMHWLRIDRYYKGDENQPEVMNMPMLCQHCENAPCENVCPVMATLHSSDGLNQQVYNRCVGTRYCANNCPYKVRRFNWFNYDRGDKLERMVLNPDVSNRTRGIMEKCSMCVQRIQEGKLQAKKERRALKDGDIKLACQQSCPGDGIVFGDMNDPKSKISKFLGDERNYTVLEELNVRPRISYLTKIRNK